MGKRIDKIKNWAKENKDEIIGVCGGIAAATAGCILMVTGYKLGHAECDLRTSLGLMRMHDSGFLKFFNPETGLEVNVEEATKLIKESNN